VPFFERDELRPVLLAFVIFRPRGRLLASGLNPALPQALQVLLPVTAYGALMQLSLELCAGYG